MNANIHSIKMSPLWMLLAAAMAALALTACEPLDLQNDSDIDGDGIENFEDNCEAVDNPDQEDADDDGVGDACEGPDADNDGVPDDIDNCEDDYNPNQSDGDDDGEGDVCDDSGFGGGGGGGGSARYILIEDMTSTTGGSAPGADIDAVGLHKLSGVTYWAAATEDFNIGGGSANEHSNPNELIGPPDSECQVKNFTALGGSDDYGMVVVSFSTSTFQGTIENGDKIFVIELGETECDQYDDDPYVVSVSDSLDAFVEIGSGEGSSEITVTGL